MTAADLVAAVENHGGKLLPIADDTLRVRNVSLLDPEMIAALRDRKGEVIAFLRQRLEVDEPKHPTNASAIRERCYPPTEPPVCAFLIGVAGEPCRRCGASWEEHYS
jgi:hypothetical protein